MYVVDSWINDSFRSLAPLCRSTLLSTHKVCYLQGPLPDTTPCKRGMERGKGQARLWQYGLWSFQTGDTKLERFLPKNQHTQRKLLNFEFWINGELSKIGHHFSNKVIQKLILSKMSKTKIVLINQYSSIEKDQDDF